MPRVVLAFDKFRGSATATELVDGVAAQVRAQGWTATGVPLGDGGEGSLEALGGPNKFATVSDPMGRPVRAGFRLEGRQAFVEMSAASGLSVVGGAGANDPVAADTVGTGQLSSHAVELGARQICVLLGGSATTDGGLGALSAMPPAARMKEVDLIAACDVRTRFVDAARVFGPQKGASAAQVELLTRRLQRLVEVYRDRYGRDVSDVPGAGAAGGLAGGLVAIGGRIESGFDVLAEHVGLDESLRGADLVVTGEGHLDAESFNGKVVGGVAAWAAESAVPVLVVVGGADDDVDVPPGIEVVSLVRRFGDEEARRDPVGLAARVVSERLAVTSR